MANRILYHFQSVINRHLKAHETLSLNVSKSLSVLHLITDALEATQSFCKVDVYIIWSLLDQLTIAKNLSNRMINELEHYKKIKNRTVQQAKSYSESSAKIRSAEEVALDKCASKP